VIKAKNNEVDNDNIFRKYMVEKNWKITGHQTYLALVCFTSDILLVGKKRRLLLWKYKMNRLGL